MTQTTSDFALHCTAYGNPPAIGMVAAKNPPLGPTDVRIAVDCAAFNFTDHLLVQGRYQDKPDLPFTPGLDAAGKIIEIGSEVRGFKPGDAVVSSGVVGAWAARLVAPAHRLVHIPAGLAPADAVASINSHLTAYHGLIDRASLTAGDRVVVFGANGAVGKACVQIAHHAGAQVYTVMRVADGLQLEDTTRQRQITVTPDTLKEGLRELLDKAGADIVVDPVGDFYTEAGVRNLAWRGRLLVIGFAAGDIPKVPTNLLLLKGASVVGVYCGGLLVQETSAFTQQMAQMFGLMAQGTLTPSPHETWPAQSFTDIWERFSSAPRGTKVLLGFNTP
ncbi:NADPH:quinone oxidoreductase family protein [Pusillimonas minor]|uniref:NADPH:quinone oxidoreductase family protein n=1 Tax=Pusillimonas minor TaxID=2697024 RepID=A0A842HM23_9BURK|nr:NADPH:quinone oxidoreductase family protein [Pusillimonas minor]MBC2768964.1 NADPH:quinone oxidoreductase family protein [Pusillimonas minor]